ncbi:hypothetical protein ACUH90_02165 [Dermabacteraceae bacterium P7054]
MGIERVIDFSKPRVLLCQRCKYRAAFSQSWIDRWGQGEESCPSCGVNSDSPERADYDWDRSDLAADDDIVLDLNWYHTTTHRNWPDPNFGFSAAPSCGPQSWVASRDDCATARLQWEARQKRKALHVGTYEAAIENMLRRLSYQPVLETQYYLYRVHLKADSVLAPGINREPTNFVGDTYLEKLGLGQGEIYRYVNVHEDEGSISLALGAEVIECVQRVPLPLMPSESLESQDIKLRLDAAELKRPKESVDAFSRFRSRPSFTNPYANEARTQWNRLSTQLPDRVQDKFSDALDLRIRIQGNNVFGKYMIGMRDVILNPEQIIKALDSEPLRRV